MINLYSTRIKVRTESVSMNDKGKRHKKYLGGTNIH